ncbi:MAG: MFS transporter [Defluviitaleaceae bacterium]|nr:MFS transporter [Defluviitaleaceae bacterium]
MYLVKKIKTHPLITLLLNLRGNPRACVYTEPLWGLPFQLYMPFASLYMFSLGLNDIEIGLLLSVSMAFQIGSAFFSGIVTDKFGRRTTLFIADLLTWSFPCLIWALSQNFWWFLAAAMLNGLSRLSDISWVCFISEDAHKDDLTGIFTLVHICGLLAVFFAPISGLLVANYSIVPVVRGIYIFAFISMGAKAILLFLFSTETAQGKVRMAETKDMKIFTMILESGGVFKTMLRSPVILITLGIMVAINITFNVAGTFFALLATNEMALPKQYLAYFPILRSGIMLALLIGAQRIFGRLGFRASMISGLIVYITAQLCLIIGAANPAQGLMFATGYVLFEAIAFGTVMPQRDALVARCSPAKDRARILAVMNTIMISGTMPFGYFAGLLSDMDRRLPFAMNIILFTLVIAIIGLARKGFEKGEEHEQTNHL